MRPKTISERHGCTASAGGGAVVMAGFIMFGVAQRSAPAKSGRWLRPNGTRAIIDGTRRSRTSASTDAPE